MSSEQEVKKIIESLSPLERAVVPYLNSSVHKIIESSGLDQTSVLRALQFLSNKGIIILTKISKNFIDIGTNGIYYKKHNLPERKLIILLEEKNHLPLEEAKKLSNLSDNEFRVSLGVLKSKALISLSNGKISLQGKKEELSKKTIEESLIEILPIESALLKDEQLLALQNLQKRKDIIEIKQ